MKTRKQTIDLVASSNPNVSTKAIRNLTSQAKHLHRVKDPSGKRPYGIMVPTGEVTNVTIPKSIRRKMSKSSSTVVPNRKATITHDLPFTTNHTGGSKPKPLDKGDYSAEIKDEREQHKNKYHKKKERS